MRSLGFYYEDIARDFLMRVKGYRFVTHNYEKSYGEIDLIFIDRDILVFVEVKGRKNTDFGYPHEFVTQEKQRKIRQVAETFMKEYDYLDWQPRFDIIEIIKEDESIHHIEAAF